MRPSHWFWNLIRASMHSYQNSQGNGPRKPLLEICFAFPKISIYWDEPALPFLPVPIHEAVDRPST
jgi:hypothetical protein